jgi:outer-membrane receptor for ferric coprogen and ferric-rhodotorulic acid
MNRADSRRAGVLVPTLMCAVAPALAGAAEPSSQPADSGTLPRIRAEATLDSTTEGTGSYTSGATSVASKIPQSARETPQSVSVITQQRIKDQNLLTLDQALAQSTGITVSNTGLSNSAFFSRGFLVQTAQIDGSPWTLATNNYGYSTPDLSLYDHVEILRGAGGLLNGAGDPGAVIGLTRKRPGADPAFTATAKLGSWNQQRVEVDATGPVFSESLRGRLIAVHEDRNYFYDVAESSKRLVSGIVEYDLTATTKVSVGGTWQQFDTVPMHGVGLPRYANGESLELPRSTFLGAAWNRNDMETEQWFAEVEHRFSDDWNLRLSGTRNQAETDYKLGFLLNAIDPATGAGAVQRGDAVTGGEDQTSIDAALIGGFDALGRHHEVMLGVNSLDRKYTSDVLSLYNAPYTPVDIFNFNPYDVPEPATPASPGANRQHTKQTGFYGMARVRVTDPLTLVVGGRKSKFEFRQHNLRTGVVQSDYDDDAFTPYGGLVLDIGKTWSVYASYAEIFQVQNLFDFQGSRLDPIVGANHEIGVKGDLRGGALTASLALFFITKENVSQRDPLHPGPTECNGLACYIAAGEQESRGVDVELSGALATNWNFYAGYTFNENEYVRDRTVTGTPSANEGRPLNAYSPKHLFRLWTDYVLPVLDGRINLGAGVNAQTALRRLNGSVEIEQPGYAIWNARLGYRISDVWSAALNGTNLFDKNYYTRLDQLSQGNMYGEPAGVMLSVEARF